MVFGCPQTKNSLTNQEQVGFDKETHRFKNYVAVQVKMLFISQPKQCNQGKRNVRVQIEAIPTLIWVNQTPKNQNNNKKKHQKSVSKQTDPLLVWQRLRADAGCSYWAAGLWGQATQPLLINQAAGIHWHKDHRQAHVDLSHGTAVPSWML